MRILWFTNIPMPAMLGLDSKTHAASGGWMMALLKQLVSNGECDISVACASPGLPEKETIVRDGICYFPISQGKAWKMFDCRSPDCNPRYLQRCIQIVNKVQPDIIHVHGSERFYGLLGLEGVVAPPVVISMQGLLHDLCKRRNYFGVASWRDILRSGKYINWLRGMNPLRTYFRFCRAARREVEILKGNRYFMGRTTWDRAHLKMLNPNASYFYVPELIRSTFFKSEWKLDSCKRHRIIFTNARSFCRGVEVLLEATSILTKQYPDVELAIAGGVENTQYGKRLIRNARQLKVGENLHFLGWLDESQMSKELCNSHAFAITSLLENSPNSLCEAQLVGLPCVASYVGGIPSLVDEGKTGLLFPAGDAAVLAERIREIFINDDLARKLGTIARKTALRRHDPQTVVRSVQETYEAVIRKTSQEADKTTGAHESGKTVTTEV